MSADNGYIIRKNDDDKYVLQMYFASNDDYPPIENAKEDDKFDSLTDAVEFYQKHDFYSEYGLRIDVKQPTKKVAKVKIEKFERKSFPVDAVRVTEENIQDVAQWCNGEIHHQADNTGTLNPYVKVKVRYPLNQRQTMAFLGDWILATDRGFKVYTDNALSQSFIKIEDDQEEASDIPLDPEGLQELRTVDDPTEIQNVFNVDGVRPSHIPGPVNPRDMIAGKRR